MNNISLFFVFFFISFSFTFLKMSHYFERMTKFLSYFFKILQKLQKLRSTIIPLHPLERLFIFAAAIYIIITISLITEILGEQINGYMRISDWLFILTIPGLIMCSIVTIYSRSIPHYIIFTIFNIIPMFLYSSLINFIRNLCDTIFCSKHDGLFNISVALFSLSALFELAFISLGYVIWRKGIWKYRNDYEKAECEKCHA
ncbi:hypothetical protein C1645_755969 [Glomus cerebriforme]|uniref:Uncharacterized protein n=1 Tax=Glomus cerebriforme TaxID=658196 RepID=A0A397TMH8_9GLOM|nr:hypothetical protein C1645_755969 [Glomus cerebriforme]